ncbi:MAG: biopolymer transporter ExbD [Chitinophagaceae bacterium]|nr:MAG: biopolymer transporter ExbD [Chitinophagaceae bacterium]
MAQMDVAGGDSGHKKGPGVKKAKKLSTRVDMTPMVDLGFLLITFFIFTATMSTPNTTKLNMPKKDEDQTKQMEVVKSGLLTILLGKDNVYYYEGELLPDGSNFMTSSFPTAENPGIRKVIQDKRAQVIAAHTHNEACKKIWADNDGDQNSCLDRDLVVVIKPDDNAKYGRSVDILDEMNINGVQRYALIEITPQEKTVLELARQRNG